jgi:hypothetical protein
MIGDCGNVRGYEVVCIVLIESSNSSSHSIDAYSYLNAGCTRVEPKSVSKALQ